MSREPNLFVVAAPSGGGKTSLVNALLERDPHIRLSVSHTTRVPRPGEIDGQHYHFVTQEKFLELVRDGAFLEHAEVFGHYYGTGRESVLRLLASGFDVMLDIDWQGARQVRNSFSSSCQIFILPPSLPELRNRLSRRGQDSAEVIENRMREARSEIAHCTEFDFQVINDCFDDALDDLNSIVRNGKPLRPDITGKIEALLAELLENV